MVWDGGRCSPPSSGKLQVPHLYLRAQFVFPETLWGKQNHTTVAQHTKSIKGMRGKVGRIVCGADMPFADTAYEHFNHAPPKACYIHT